MATETLTSPAWIDIHAHVAGLARFGVDPTAHGVVQGVDTLVDAGSAPPYELPDLLAQLQPTTSTRVLAWANICAEGIADKDCAHHDTTGCAAHAALRALPGAVVGIKLQASNTRLADRGLEAIETAKEVASAFDVPLMVHVGNAPPSMREVLPLLRPGDIVTHFAHGKPLGALSDDGRPHPTLLEAREGGVLFDLGHGAGSFSFRVMESLAKHGFWPDIISTDLHAGSAVSPVGSLADCMAKLLALGMPPKSVLDSVTTRPREALQLPPTTNITRFELRDEPWTATDSYGETRELSQRIVPLAVEPAA